MCSETVLSHQRWPTWHIERRNFVAERPQFSRCAVLHRNGTETRSVDALIFKGRHRTMGAGGRNGLTVVRAFLCITSLRLGTHVGSEGLDDSPETFSLRDGQAGNQTLQVWYRSSIRTWTCQKIDKGAPFAIWESFGLEQAHFWVILMAVWTFEAWSEVVDYILQASKTIQFSHATLLGKVGYFWSFCLDWSRPVRKQTWGKWPCATFWSLMTLF